MKLPDLVGQRFGKLLVLRFVDMGRDGRNSRWLCRCDCGVKKVIRAHNFKNSTTVSCGCVRLERQRAAVTTHGQTGSKEHWAWVLMRRRCRDSSYISYARYGGRGISVCARWDSEDGFVAFLEDMGRAPSPAHSLDRFPNRDGNYAPGNCRWATPQQQAENRDSSVLISHGGETLTASEWARRLGFKNSSAISLRIESGWAVADAVTTPPLRGAALAARVWAVRRAKEKKA